MQKACCFPHSPHFLAILQSVLRCLVHWSQSDRDHCGLCHIILRVFFSFSFVTVDSTSVTFMVESTLVHLVAGGFAGTVAGIITCPLEVVKTRLQSSIVQLPSAPQSRQLFLIRFVKNIIETEGTRALFKGLAPNLVGVAPSRALYFCAYTKTKDYLNENFASSPDAMPVHAASAMAAGFLSSTLTNPIWFIKTRLQLDQSRDSGTSAFSCAKSIYRESGLRGFYKGITASYFGISETILHFVTYEFIKSKLSQWYTDLDSQTRFVQCMAAGAASKTFASILAYPHGE